MLQCNWAASNPGCDPKNRSIPTLDKAAGDRAAGGVGDYDVGNMGPWMKDNARLYINVPLKRMHDRKKDQ